MAGVHHPAAHALWRQAGRYQALHRPHPVGIHEASSRSDAGNRRRRRLRRGRRLSRGRHRRGADRVQRPHRRADARRPAVRAQHAEVERRPCAIASSIGVAGKIVSAFDIARRAQPHPGPTGPTRRAASCSRSAACGHARATPTCNCPTGVATRGRAAASARWWSRTRPSQVYNFHRLTLRALSEMLAAAGLQHPDELEPHHLVPPGQARPRSGSSASLHTFLEARRTADGRRLRGRLLRRQLEARLRRDVRGVGVVVGPPRRPTIIGKPSDRRPIGRTRLSAS